MSVFLVALGLGLGGLVLMALPGMRRHGRAGHGRVHAQGKTHVLHGPRQGSKHGVAGGLLHYVPEPHVIFSLLALFGAFGNVLQRTLHLPLGMAAVGAAVIAVPLEWLLVGRLWRLASQFTGEPASPLGSLVMDRAEAVTAFRNGKGIVRAVLDGRAVQLTAELVADEKTMTVRVGDRMTIQEVDSNRQRVRVSLR